MEKFIETRWQKIKSFPIKRSATAAAICQSLGLLISGIVVYSFDLLQKGTPMNQISLCVLASYAVGAFVHIIWEKIAEQSSISN